MNFLSSCTKTCEGFGMKINVKNTNSIVISKMNRTGQIKITNEEIERVTGFKYLECLVREDMCCS